MPIVNIVPKSKKVEDALAEKMPELRERVKGGPSWVHANLTRGYSGEMVIILGFGANVGNSKPTINVSYEDREIVLKSPCL